MTNNINGRTPEEIKRGLECCLPFDEERCCSCPYWHGEEACYKLKNKDVLAYIQQLERERDAAVKDNAANEELASCSLRLLNLTIDQLVKQSTDIPCEELSCSEQCSNHCTYSRPQRECWARYLFWMIGSGVQEVES